MRHLWPTNLLWPINPLFFYGQYFGLSKKHTNQSPFKFPQHLLHKKITIFITFFFKIHIKFYYKILNWIPKKPSWRLCTNQVFICFVNTLLYYLKNGCYLMKTRFFLCGLNFGKNFSHPINSDLQSINFFKF